MTNDAPELCTESFGRPQDPPLLLIMGQMASMLWWPEAFCRRLADAGRFVIRYDHRDTGRSTYYEPGRPPYTGDDLVDDTIVVLDRHGIDRVHLVGMSMGGAIAQLAALKHPARVSTLTIISCTPLGVEDDLPGPDPEYLRQAQGSDGVDWSDRRQAEEYLVGESRRLAGTRHPFDEAALREFVARDLARTVSPASLINHTLVDGGPTPAGGAAAIAAPLLVVHGTADPLFPYAHGVALAAAVPGSTLVAVEGGGHELHVGDWDQICGAILEHTAPR
jgi:pimeloyl-ACP methyl ester carboxylesterase